MLLAALVAGCFSASGDEEIVQPPRPFRVDRALTPDSFLRFENTFMRGGTSQIGSAAYANAYYETVDPRRERRTLAAWKAINGFDAGEDAHVTFRDTLDLGYGRDMYARRRVDGGMAIYVDNYVVEVRPGDASSYGPINLSAAIAQDRKFQISTSALEFAPIDPDDPGSENIVKFFLFGPPAADGSQALAMFEDLDGRGVRALPTACFVCHGGTAYPLNDDGSFPLDSLKSLKMNLLDPQTFEFGDLDEARQRAGIKSINRMVFDSYVAMGTVAQMGQRDETEAGVWSNAFAVELATGAYGADFARPDFDTDFVPAGWRRTPNRPDAVERLYTEVVRPHCIGCHALRGSNTGEQFVDPVIVDGEPARLGNAVNFSSYEKFIAYTDLIIDKVYRRGNMPMSLINYTRFWADPGGPPTFLATFLDGFDVFDAAGRVAPPGRPLPLPGDDRTVASPAVQDATATLFADRFDWQLVSQPVGAIASLGTPDRAITTLTADTDGDYVLRLTASNSRATDSREVTLEIDNRRRPRQNEVTFAEHIITTVLESGSFARSCASCHSESSEFTGIAVTFDRANPTLYKDVLERVNLRDPENSLLLRKPTNLHHGGGIVLDRTDAGANGNYVLLLNWIRNGAPCGTDPTVCD